MASGESIPGATATPILDSAVLPKPARRKRLVSTIWGVLLGLLFAAMLIYDDQHNRRSPAADYMVLFYFAVIMGVVVVHEVGHLLAGWIVGFRFSRISIGPLCLKIEHGRLKVEGRGRLTGAAGYAGMHVNSVRRLRRRLLIFTLGGPTANLLSFAVMIALLDYSAPGAPNNWLALPARLFAQISLIIGLVNLVPFSVGALFSDGARIAMLFRSRARTRRWMSIAAIGDQNQKGVRPRQFRRTWLNAASSLHDGSVDDVAGNLLAYAAANDGKDEPIAALRLERCLELMHLLGPSTQNVISLEAAVFSSWFRKNPVIAQKWFEHVKKLKAITPLQRIRVDVALLCGREEFELALPRWQEGLAFISKLPAAPTQKRLLEGWLEWQEQIRQRQGEVQASGVGR